MYKRQGSEEVTSAPKAYEEASEITRASKRHVDRSVSESGRTSPWLGRGTWYNNTGPKSNLVWIPGSHGQDVVPSRELSRTDIARVPKENPDYTSRSGTGTGGEENPEEEFDIFKVIGKGASGKVYAATNKEGRIVAIKVVPIKKNRDMLAREIRMMNSTKIRHRNLLSSQKTYYNKGKFWIVMELSLIHI